VTEKQQLDRHHKTVFFLLTEKQQIKDRFHKTVFCLHSLREATVRAACEDVP